MASAAPAPQSVDRIFAMLEHLARERSGASLAALARHTKAPKTSLVGLLAGMVEGGWLARDGQGRYTLGPHMLSLAMQVTARTDLTVLARPLLEALSRETGETALLGALAPDADISMYIDKVESTNPVRYTVSLGERRELYSSAVGKLLLAYLPPARREAYLRHVKFERFTPNTISSVSALRREIAAISKAGLSCTESERVAGASAIAAPVLDREGRLVVGVCLAGPSDRIRTHRRELEKRVRATAQALAALVAGREPESTP